MWGGFFHHGGTIIFLPWARPKGGAEFFPVYKGGDQKLFTYAKGGAERIGNRPSQTDAPPPGKKWRKIEVNCVPLSLCKPTAFWWVSSWLAPSIGSIFHASPNVFTSCYPELRVAACEYIRRGMKSRPITLLHPGQLEIQTIPKSREADFKYGWKGQLEYFVQ